MSEKKKDKKGRVLRGGERQREDGRYEYRYTDKRGQTHSVYSWTLVPNDSPPPGKKKGKSLREKIDEITVDKIDGIDTASASTITLNQAYELMMSIKRGTVKESTYTSYKTAYERYAMNAIGTKPISAINPSVLKLFYTKLQKENGLTYGTVKIIHGVIKQSLQTMVDDDKLRKNPAVGVLTRLVINEGKGRHALTREQQDRFLEYVSNANVYKRWSPLLTLLFGTGMRCGEACALTWDDIDFENRIIHVRHTYMWCKDDSGYCHFELSTPKTKSSIRDIPMLDDVESVLKKSYMSALKAQGTPSKPTGNVFHTTANRWLSPRGLTRVVKRICESLNKQEQQLAVQEGREPNLVPIFTPHVIRHTFCTRMCEANVNVKAIQKIMGHKSIQITMDIYNEATEDIIKEAMAEADGSFRVAAV